MIKSTLRFGVLFSALLALATSLQAQTAFWSEDFSGGGVPADWTNIDESGQDVIFEWCDDPQNDGGDSCPSWFSDAINLQDPFAGTTATNGFLSCDSDEAGALASNHIAQLTTSAIDCSGQMEVWFKFDSHIGVYDVSANIGALIKVSTDGVNWDTYLPYPDLTTTVRWSENPEIVILDISATAAGQSAVYIQYEWTGNWEYQWSIDDLALYDSDPTLIFVPPHDMRVNDNFYAVAPNLFWPLEMVETFGFLADVENIGSLAQTNVLLNVTIEDEALNVVYTEDLDYGTLDADSLAENVPFPGAGFLPTAMGDYFGTYTISADSADVNPDNNSVGFAFNVSDKLFAKDDGVELITRPADDSWDVDEPWSWAYGNYFYVPTAGDYVFDEVSFTLDVSAATDLAGENVIVRIYEWTDDNADEQADPNERTEIASMIYTIDGTEVGEDFIYIPVTTLLGDPVALSDDTQYLVMVEFQTDIVGKTVEMGMASSVDYGAMTFRTGLDGAPRYGSFLGVLGNLDEEAYSSLGFGTDFLPTVGFTYKELSSTKELLLLNGNLSTFPNPANNEVTLDMDFNETMQDVTVQLFDLTGKLLETQTMENVKRQQASFNVSTLANGNYIFKVTTEQGTRSERFTVQR
jgi:hypothetical protein